MKQAPSNLKFKKYHKASSKFLNLMEQKSFIPSRGLYALKSVDSGKLTFKHIEAGRRAIRRTIKKTGDMWIKVFTYASVSKKPTAVRMGKGKGSHSYWMCPIRPGQIIYEIGGAPVDLSLKALKSAGTKLPFKTSIIKLIY